MLLRQLFSHLVSIDGKPLRHQLKHMDDRHPQGWVYEDVINWLLPRYLSKGLADLDSFLRHDLVDPRLLPEPCHQSLALTEGDRHAASIVLKHVLPFIIFGIGRHNDLSGEKGDLFDMMEEEVEALWIPSRNDLVVLTPYLTSHPLGHDCDEVACRRCHRERREMYRNLITHGIWEKFLHLT